MLTNDPGRLVASVQRAVAGFRSFPTKEVLMPEDIVINSKVFTPSHLFGGSQKSVAGFKSFPTKELLTPKEIVIYKRLFDQMDSNKDGFLTRDDLRKGLKDFVNYSATEHELKETMETLDSDGDGSVSFDEFISYVAWSRHMTEEAIKDAFRTFDRDNDGLISKSEVREALLSLGVAPNEAILENIFSHSEKHKDGTLTLEEFRQLFYKKGTTG